MDNDVDKVIAENVAQSVLNQYNQIVTNGKGKKPAITIHAKHEYTVLSSIVLVIPSRFFPRSNPNPNLKDEAEYRHLPISISTGLKTQPMKHYSIHGDILHDSHSEVLSRRGCRHWLLQRLVKEKNKMESLKNNLNLWDGTLRNGSGSNNDNVSKEGDLAAKWTIDDLPRVFQLETTNTQEGQDRDDLSVDRKFNLRDGIQSWFYISTLPCGDASMKLMQKEREFQDQATSLSKQSSKKDVDIGADQPSDSSNPPNQDHVPSTSNLNIDDKTTLHQATCQSCLLQDSSASNSSSLNSNSKDFTTIRGRNSIERLGRLRTKPGRADSSPSISHSCSDKLALWSTIGLQGSTLSRWLNPIYIDGYVIGDEEIERVWNFGQQIFQNSKVGQSKGGDAVVEEKRLEFRREIERDCERALVDRWRDWIRGQKAFGHDSSNEIISLLQNSKPPKIHLTSQKFSYSFSSVSLRLQQDEQVSKAQQPRLDFDSSPTSSSSENIKPISAIDEESNESQIIPHQLCLTWVRDSFTENLNGGIKQGSSLKRKPDQALGIKSRSSLCKLNWFNQIGEAWRTLNEDRNDEIEKQSYYELKHQVGERGSEKYQRLKALLRGDVVLIEGEEHLLMEGSRRKRSQLLLDHFLSQIEGEVSSEQFQREKTEVESIERQTMAAQTFTFKDALESKFQGGGRANSPFRGWLISGKKYEDFFLSGQSSR